MPDVGAARERQQHGGERQDAEKARARASGPGPRGRTRAAGSRDQGREPRERHVVRERRADAALEVVAAVEELPDPVERPAASPLARERQEHRARPGRRVARGPSRSARAGRARAPAGAARSRPGRARRRPRRPSAARARAGRRRSATAGSGPRRSRTTEAVHTDEQEPGGDVRRRDERSQEGEEKEEGEGEPAQGHPIGDQGQRPAASEPGRASSISMTGMSDTIG